MKKREKSIGLTFEIGFLPYWVSQFKDCIYLSGWCSFNFLAIIDAFVHNNPRDPTKERFARLEEKFIDISCNMSLLIVDLANKFEPFREVSVSNSKFGSNEKPRDGEDIEKESRKDLKK